MNQLKLKDLTSYDPETGVFLLLKTTSRQLIRKLPYELGQKCNPEGYKVAMIERVTYQLHNLAWLYMTGDFAPEGLIVDHKNLIPHDNRWDNLRLLTKAENIRNQSASKSFTDSGRTGVFFRAGEKSPYKAHIRVDKKLITLGSFASLEQAVDARVEAELKYFNTTHGE